MSNTEKKRGFKAWVRKLMGRRAPAAAPPAEQPSGATAAPSPGAVQAARGSIGKFSLTWDDVGQYFRLIGAPTSYLYPYTNWIGWQDDELDRLLRASAWSWAAVNGNSKAMCQLTPVVQERVAGKWQVAGDEHPLWGFLKDPLGTDATLPWWPWAQLLYVTALHYYVVGNAYWLPVESAGGLSVLPIMSPHRVEAEENIYKAPALYKMLRPKGGQSKWAPDKIVNIMAPSASSLWRGSSPLQAALRSVEIDSVATERQRSNLINRASPGLTVALDHPLGANPAQRAELTKQLENNYVEATDDGKPWVIGQAAHVFPGFSSQELQVFDTKASSQAEIMATIGIQPSIMGQLDRATYSNTKEATLLWWYSSIQPVLTLIYDHANAQMVRRRYSDARLWFTLAGSNIGLQLIMAKLDAAEKLSRLGLATMDIATMLELDIPERDYLRVPVSSWITAGRVEPERIAQVIEELQAVTNGEAAAPRPSPAPEADEDFDADASPISAIRE